MVYVDLPRKRKSCLKKKRAYTYLFNEKKTIRFRGGADLTWTIVSYCWGNVGYIVG